MAYTKQTWEARTGQGLNRFTDQDGNMLILTSTPQEVISPGTPFTADRMNHIEAGIEGAYPIIATSVSVPVADFVSDTTYADYPYRAAVAVTGATASMIPEAVFSLTDAVGGILAPVAEAYAGGVYIYASEAPAAAVTIASLTVWKAV